MAETCKCGNCEWTGAIEAADPFRDFWSRVEPGDTVPAGDCPECGAFVFISEDGRGANVVETARADLLARIDRLKDGAHSADQQLESEVDELLDDVAAFLKGDA